MIYYIVPKEFDNNWARMIKYIEKLNNLDIKYNPKKSLFPRLKNTNKRGKVACEEIMKELNCYFKSKNHILEELCFCLKNKLKVQYGIKNILCCAFSDITNIDVLMNFFNNHDIFYNLCEATNKIYNILQSNNIKELFIDPVIYLKEHIENVELNNEQKVKLIKFILK